MNNLINFTAEHTNREVGDVGGFNNNQDVKPCERDIFEDEAFIITTYFTNVWQRAHDHNVYQIPGTFPARSYGGQKLSLKVEHYDIALKLNVFEIEPEINYYAYQWHAVVADTKTNDVLDLVIESEYDYSPGSVASQKGEACANMLVKCLLCQCESEFGYTIEKAQQLRLETYLKTDDIDDEECLHSSPQWFSTAIPGYCASFPQASP